jgi:hypothetical protein
MPHPHESTWGHFWQDCQLVWVPVMKALAVFEESKANGDEYAEIAIKSKRNLDIMM